MEKGRNSWRHGHFSALDRLQVTMITPITGPDKLGDLIDALAP
jgi:hypothetical protein